MDLDVVGRHALLFDDDATAAFVNSGDALVDWNSLLIDRYDVCHLLQNPPPSFRRQRHQTNSSSPNSVPSSESELNHERYLDLPPPSDEQELGNGVGSVDAGAYRDVAFLYGNPDDSTDQKNAEAGLGYSGFRPPFPVPGSLLRNLEQYWAPSNFKKLLSTKLKLLTANGKLIKKNPETREELDIIEFYKKTYYKLKGDGTGSWVTSQC